MIVFLSITFLCFLAYKLANTFQVPKKLKGIPIIPLFPLFISVIKGDSFEKIYNSLILPVLGRSGHALLWVQGRWKLVVSDPKQAQEILSNSAHFLKKEEEDFTRIKRLSTAIAGSSNILNSDNKEWRHHRRVANPVFKKSWDLNLFSDIISDAFDNIERYNHSEIDVDILSQNITLDALGKGIFSYNFEAVKNSENNENLVLYDALFKAILNPLYTTFPKLESICPFRIRAFNQCDRFRKFIYNIVEERRQEINNGISKDDLLTRLIEASIKEESPLSDKEVINNLVVFFIAGHDTTANTLAAIFYFLSKNPEIQEKARKEVIEILGSHSEITVPTSAQLKSMNYLNCIIKESMRIVTTVGFLSRYSPKSVMLSDGTQIPEDTHIIIDNWSIHHDPEVYSEPENFKPERFMETHTTQTQQWMPFGYGSRMCIGIKFSLIELQVIIATFLQKYRLTLNNELLQEPYKVSSKCLLKIENNKIIFNLL